MTFPHNDPDFLDDLDRSYGDAPAPAPRDNTKDPLRGTFQVVVDAARMDAGKGYEGSDRFSLGLKVLGPTNAGRYLWRNHNMRKDGVEYLKRDIYTCGLPDVRPSQLYDGDTRARFVGLRLNIKADVNKNGYQVVYLNSLIDATPGEYDERNPPPASDRGLPVDDSGRPLF